MTEVPTREALPAELGEDTMELELTAEEELELARAAEAVDAQGPMAPDYETYIRTRTHRIDLIGTVTFVSLVLVGATLAGWRVLREPTVSPAVAYHSPPAAEVAAPIAPEQPTFVRVANPFDAGEVFELPADMTEAEARDAVAEVLLNRARERAQQGVNFQYRHRTRPAPVLAGTPTEIVVTPVPRPSGPIPD